MIDSPGSTFFVSLQQWWIESWGLQIYLTFNFISFTLNPGLQTMSVADPEFPPAGGGGGGGWREHTIFPHSPKNCMKLKEFGRPGVGGIA